MTGRPRETNKFWRIGSAVLIDVSTSKHPKALAIIDAADIDAVIDGCGRWCAQQTYRHSIYAGRCSASAPNAMHRAILRPSAGARVDHANGDGLDNRRCNIRLASAAQNAWNQRGRGGGSGMKGVSFHRATGMWQAQICIGYANKYLGVFHDKTQAAAAYDAAAQAAHGEFFRNTRGT